MTPYRPSGIDAMDAWRPAKPDWRPRLAIPLVPRLPDLGATTDWDDTVPSSPFILPLEHRRLWCSTMGIDVGLAAADPTLASLPPDRQTRVSAVAWAESSRNYVLHLRFECRDPDMSRVRDLPDTPSLKADYVSLLVNPDGVHDHVVEVGITATGHHFRRSYRQFLSAHGSEPTLHAEAPTWTGQVTEELAFEDRQGASWKQVHGHVQLHDDRWVADLQIPFNHFGGYLGPGQLLPANFFRRDLTPIPGAPLGISWKAAGPGSSWSPVRFQVEEFADAGFLALGDMSTAEMDRQVQTLDSAARRARLQRRSDLLERQLGAASTWRASIDPATIDTQWQPKAIPGFAHITRGFLLNNGRQLWTDADGATWVLAEDANRLELVKTPAVQDPVRLPQSACERQHLATADGLSHASMVCDRSGDLHVVYACADGCFHARRTTGWTARRLDLPPGALPFDLEADGARVILVATDAAQSLHLYDLATDARQTLPWSGRCPVLAAASAGGLHLAYEANATIYYARLDADLSVAEDATIAAYAVTAFPAILEVDRQPLLVYQHMGVQPCDPDPSTYVAERERAGGGIGYAHRTANGWRRGYVAKAEEIICRRLDSRMYMLDMVNRPHAGVAFPVQDQNWRPALGLGPDGSPRAVWQNTARTWAYEARWTGHAFTPPTPIAGPLPGPSSQISVEKRSPDATQAKTLLVAEKRLILDALPTGAVDLERSEHLSFVDQRIVQRSTGLTWQSTQAERLSTDPILSLPGTGLGQGRDGLGRPSVIRGEGAWLMLCKNLPSGHAYAASDDGLSWQLVDKSAFNDLLPTDWRGVLDEIKPDMDQPPTASLLATFGGIEDSLEPDPEKRYKKITVEGRKVDDYAPRRLWYSADGRHWREGPLAQNNIHLNETHLPNLYDPWDIPERRFKIYGRTTSVQGRSLAMLWSADMIQWHGDVEPVVREDPWSRPAAPRSSPAREARIILEGSAEAWDHEHYYCLPWQEAGMYMLMVGTLNHDGHKDLRLACSRDGFHFQHVGSTPLLANGAPGSFDAGSIDSPCQVHRDGETWLYYGAGGEKHGSLPYTGQHAIGLARIGRRQWSCYRIAAGETTGELTTITITPTQLTNRQLRVNISHVSHPTDLQVELLDAADDRCLATAELAVVASHHAAALRWTSGSWQDDRPCRLRFNLSGDLRLYGFSLSKG